MKELYRTSQYYGHGSILKRYAGFPRRLPIPVAVQHGWTLHPRATEALSSAAENWYWSTVIERAYTEQFPDVQTRAVGAPFLYLLRLLNYRPDVSAQRGSIVFPAHSSASIEMSSDFDAYAEQLDALPDEYKPITVCMYHLDATKGLEQPFAAKGFEITSNGDQFFSEQFLRKFIDNTAGKRYAFANQMTSALLYATAMGLTSFFFGPLFEVFSNDANYAGIDYTAHHRSWEQRFADAFRFPDAEFKAQKAVAMRELGGDLLLDEQTMNQLLWRHARSPQYRTSLGRASRSRLGKWLKP